MDKKESTRNILTGLFFLLGVALIVFFVVTIGKNRGITQSKFAVEVLFRNVKGLMEGAPVRLAGVNVGSVNSIDFLDQDIEGRRVKATLHIFSKYRNQFNRPLAFAINTEGILGEKLIEIAGKSDGPPIDLSQPIFGEDSIDVQDLAETFGKAAQTFTGTVEELNKIDMVELATVLRDSSKALLETSLGLNTLMADFKDITVKSKRVMDRLEQRLIDGNLFKVF
ncbi:MAG: MlaD family protein [Candidatus Omnitrophota bacterium]|nr:MlaD family protein [Candidatus Omnitrophota bacterium]